MMSEVNIFTGKVVAAYRRYTLVENDNNDLIQCQQRKSIGQVVCGDNVVCQQEDDGSGVIVHVEERHTVLQRPDINNNLRVIASNIDQVFIVVANKPKLNEGLIDRYLVAAENNQLVPVIVLNKTDLYSQEEIDEIKSRLQVYSDIGYQVFYTSAKSDFGLDKLLNQLDNKNNIFVGQSGVGKTSLLNALLQSDARVGEISEATGKGKHTTTTAYLYPLKNNNGHIIDSPGVREFGLIELSEQDVTDGFVEFRPYLGCCKFRNCSHTNEPGCALLKAVDENEISKVRWSSYQRIIQSLAETKNNY